MLKTFTKRTNGRLHVGQNARSCVLRTMRTPPPRYKYCMRYADILREAATPASQFRNAALSEHLPGVNFDIVVTGNNTVSLEHISVETRGIGMGKAVMTFLCDLADQHGVTLTLQPVSQGGLPQDELVSFYVKFGFDFIEGDNVMVRPPA